METEFRCNICGQLNVEHEPERIHRELLNCKNCNSNARFRGVVYALQKVYQFDQGIALNNAPTMKRIKGVGMSDSEVYAQHLERIFEYKNTYFHQEPFLDVTNEVSASRYNELDFVICSEVLEHVLTPVDRAFKNIKKMLNPDGRLILSVPYLEGVDTFEHFPHLYDWRIERDESGEFLLLNKPIGSAKEDVHRNIYFHGGPGTVLEMRMFGEQDLMNRLKRAGFQHVEVLEANNREIGYFWEPQVERADWLGRRSKSYIIICS